MRGPLVRVPLCGSLLSASRRSQGEMPFEKIERRGHHSFVNTLQQDGLGRIPVVKEVVDEPDDDSLLFHAARWRDGGSDVSPGATESSTDSCLQDAAQSAHMDVREEVIRLISDMLQTAHIHTQRGHQRGTCSGLIATTLPGLIKFGAHFKEAGVVSPAHTQAHVVRWRPWWPPGHPQRAARARWGLELAQHGDRDRAHEMCVFQTGACVRHQTRRARVPVPLHICARKRLCARKRQMNHGRHGARKGASPKKTQESTPSTQKESNRG
jgi:hypothetical protein